MYAAGVVKGTILGSKHWNTASKVEKYRSIIISYVYFGGAYTFWMNVIQPFVQKPFVPNLSMPLEPYLPASLGWKFSFISFERQVFELLFTQNVSLLKGSMIKANGETLLIRHLLNSNVSKIFPCYCQILVRQAIPQKTIFLLVISGHV